MLFVSWSATSIDLELSPVTKRLRFDDESPNSSPSHHQGKLHSNETNRKLRSTIIPVDHKALTQFGGTIDSKLRAGECLDHCEYSSLVRVVVDSRFATNCSWSFPIADRPRLFSIAIRHKFLTPSDTIQMPLQSVSCI